MIYVLMFPGQIDPAQLVNDALLSLVAHVENIVLAHDSKSYSFLFAPSSSRFPLGLILYVLFLIISTVAYFFSQGLIGRFDFYHFCILLAIPVLIDDKEIRNVYAIFSSKGISVGNLYAFT